MGVGPGAWPLSLPPSLSLERFVIDAEDKSRRGQRPAALPLVRPTDEPPVMDRFTALGFCFLAFFLGFIFCCFHLLFLLLLLFPFADDDDKKDPPTISLSSVVVVVVVAAVVVAVVVAKGLLDGFFFRDRCTGFRYRVFDRRFNLESDRPAGALRARDSNVIDQPRKRATPRE